MKGKKTLLPKTEDESLQDLDIALGDEISEYFKEGVDGLDQIIDFEKQDNGYLAEIANMLGVEYWQSQWEDKKKVEFLKDFVKLKRHAGTKGVINKILNFFGDNIQILEWYEREGLKGALNKGNVIFNLERIGNKDMHKDLLKDLLHALIDIYKPVWVRYTFQKPLYFEATFKVLKGFKITKAIHIDGDIEKLKLELNLLNISIFKTTRYIHYDIIHIN